MRGGRFHSGNTWCTFKVLILNSIRLASMAMVFWCWPYFSIVETVQIQLHLKWTWNIPESYIPSLGTSCENMALKNACIDSVWGSTCPKTFSGAIVTLVTGIGSGLSKQTNWALMKLGIPQLPHYPIGVKRIHVSSPNVEGTIFQTFLNYNSVQATFLYSINFITKEQVKLISSLWEGSISRWDYFMYL